MVPCTWHFQKWTGKAWGVVRKCHERRLYTSGPIRLCASWPLFCSKGSSRGRCSSACSSVFYTGEGCCARCGRPSLTFGTNAPDCDWFKPSAGTLTVNTELLSFGEGKLERRKKLHFNPVFVYSCQKKKTTDRTHWNLLTSVSTRLLRTLHKGCRCHADQHPKAEDRCSLRAPMEMVFESAAIAFSARCLARNRRDISCDSVPLDQNQNVTATF